MIVKGPKSNYYKYIDWIPNLSKEDKDWYYTFNCAYYYQNKKCMDKLKFPIELRRSIYNKHRAVKACPFNKGLVDAYYNVDDFHEEDDNGLY